MEREPGVSYDEGRQRYIKSSNNQLITGLLILVFIMFAAAYLIWTH